MASSGSGYDLYSSTFSPDGRIFQVEYAGKAVDNGGTAIGILIENHGVVLGVCKPLQQKMLVSTSSPRIFTVASNCGVGMTGFIPDGRQVVGRAREEAANYVETYGSSIPPTILADRMASYVHYFTLHGALRPFGASCMVAGYDEVTKSPSLHMVEPNGVAYAYRACAAGKGKQPAKTELEKLELHKANTTMTVQEAVKQIAKIVYMLYDENKDKPFELEMSWLSEETQWKHQGVPKDVLSEAITWAKEQLEEEEDDDEEEGEGMEE
jgi:20S proteasome subunit alpha 7